MLPVPVILEPTTLDGKPWIIARDPVYPGCMSDGATPDEAVTAFLEARQVYVESMIEDGLIPASSVKITGRLRWIL